MNDMPLYNKDKPLEQYVVQLALTISGLSADLSKANDKILKLEEMLDNCVSYIMKNQSDRYQTRQEHIAELIDYDFKIGGTD